MGDNSRVTGSLVGDLDISGELWLLLSLMALMTLFFKFSRIVSLRNLDLFLLFALAPGMMFLVGDSGRGAGSLTSYTLLLSGSMLWLIRCLADVGLGRRPLLEPNLNAAGLAFLGISLLLLLMVETISLPVKAGKERNPAETGLKPTEKQTEEASKNLPVKPLEEVGKAVLEATPVASQVRLSTPQEIISRIIATLSHLTIVVSLIIIGWRHFLRPVTGISAAVGYVLLPYTRIALVDSGQALPAALITLAIVFYRRPWITGVLIGLAAGWMPACLGVIPVWMGYYRGKKRVRFTLAGVALVLVSALIGIDFPDFATWVRALGARSVTETGLLFDREAPISSSLWTGLDPSFRLPVVVAYLIMAIGAFFWPAEKHLGELISISAAMLIASQFWYLEKGGTLVLLYLPLLLLMMFRPNLQPKQLAWRAQFIRQQRSLQEQLS
ncbi:MAG: hypothetical protein RJA81_2005 [Planctomycetota bacterium]